MSVNSEINRISSNISSAYDAVEEKGGDLPETKNSDNLATAISSIPIGGTGDYEKLSNKPQINSVELSGNKSLSDLGIQSEINDLDAIRSGASKGETALQSVPTEYKTKTENDGLYQPKGSVPTKTSELTNDSGYVTEAYHDATKQDVLTQAEKQAIADLHQDPTVPTTLAELADDSTHRVVTDAEKTAWNAKSTFSGNYNDLTNKPTIPTVPTNVSAFTNDSGYVTNAYHDSTKQNVLTDADKQAIADLHSDSVTSVNGQTGDVTVSSTEQMYYYVPSDKMTRVQNETKGVAPYSTLYGSTEITIDADSGIEWKEGAVYRFEVTNDLIANTTYRNVKIRIGDGEFIPVCNYAGSASSTYALWVVNMNQTFVYDTRFFATGGLTHMNYDTNSTYSYLINQISSDSTDSPIRIDDVGFGAKGSLMFATTPLSDENGLVTEELWSSLVGSYSTGTTKKAVTPKSGKFYIDRHPCSVYTANVSAGAKPVNLLYQDYSGIDLRFTYNISKEYLSRSEKCFLWLKNFSEAELSFEADATIGNIVSLDNIANRFPSNLTGAIYLYFLGWTQATWYILTPNFTQVNRIFKYTPSTGNLEVFNKEQSGGAAVTFTIESTAWTNDTSASGYYTQEITLTSVLDSKPRIDIESTGSNTLPTSDEQTAYDCVKYVTVDSATKKLKLYAEKQPSATFAISVRGVK